MLLAVLLRGAKTTRFEEWGSSMRASRQAQQQATAPFCDGCDVEMAWTHSELIAAENAIAHVFACRICSRVIETKAPANAEKQERRR
jgi:hypothetical protein